MSKSKKQQPSEATATKLMPLFCFEVLDNALQGKGHPKYPEGLGTEPSSVPKRPYFKHGLPKEGIHHFTDHFVCFDA